jgi:hypothetical protein
MVDGIVGLGQSIFSLPSQFQEIYSNIFSYCLVSFDSSTMNVSAFFFGSLEGLTINNNLFYIPIIQNDVFPQYYVDTIVININNTMLNIRNNTFDINPSMGLTISSLMQAHQLLILL